jgi:hypothetical protein
MERVKRFELSTSSLARKRSSQLSYTRLTIYRQGWQGVLPLRENVNGPDRLLLGRQMTIIAGIPLLI